MRIHHLSATPPDQPDEHSGAGSVAWRLDRIFPSLDAPSLRAEEREAAECVSRMQAYRGTIGRADVAAAHVRRVIADYERFQELSERLRAFGYLHANADHADGQKKALNTRLEEAQQRWQADLVFIEVELRGIPEPRLAELIADPLLAAHRHFLRRQQAQARFTLSEPEERVIAKKNIAGRNALVRFREELAAQMDFGRFPIDGAERSVTEADLAGLRYHPDPGVREAARVRVLETYRRQLDIYTFVYTSVVKDHAIECELRGFARPMDAENVPNEIDGMVVDRLVAVNRERLPLFHAFYQWKARKLGVARLKSSDLAVPLLQQPPRKIPWREAAGWLMRAMRNFSPEFAAAGARLFDEERIDAPPRKGKSAGAFCYPVAGRDPFILVNYTGNISAVTTLAHEVGHGVHFILSRERQPLLQAYWMSKVMAETASEFNELLLTDLLMEEAADPAIRRSLLGHMVDRFVGMVDRQLMLTEFEEAAHAAVGAGPTGAAFLCDTWARLCREHFGPSVELLDPDPAGWSAVPHFVATPFYCYSYALSQVAVLALYATYREAGRGFADSYLELLRSGGSGTPAELLGRAGVDLADPRVLGKAYDEFDRLVAALRREVGD